MNISQPRYVTKLFINTKEEEHKSRNRLGFHVFLSRYIYDFRKLSLMQQKHLVKMKLSINFFPREDVSIDSTSSLIDEKVKHCYVMKLACNEWKKIYNNKMKIQWQKRATILNARKLPGKFVNIPINIKDKLHNHVMDSLTYEWESLIKVLKNSITSAPKRILAIKKYKFGHELVTLHSQSYRDIKLSYILELTIFGQGYNNLLKKEIIKKTNKTMLVHIASKERMDVLFSKEDYCATEFVIKTFGGGIVTTAGKVNVLRYGKNMQGYILKQKYNKWLVLFLDDSTAWIDIPLYCNDSHRYKFNCKKGNNQITEYWPIRIIIKLKGGGLRFTLNRLGYTSTKRGKKSLLVPFCS